VITDVLVDGCLEPLKLKTTLERQNERISAINVILDYIKINAASDIMPDEVYAILHPLLENYFLETLSEMNISFTVCDNEADPIVAQVAKQKKALVIANDSDYYFMDIPMGYIPLYLLDVKQNSVNYKIFKRSLFLKEYNLKASELGRIAEILGTDYHDPEISITEKYRLEKAILMLREEQKSGNVNITPSVNIPSDDFKQVKDVLNDEQMELFRSKRLDSKVVDILCGHGFITQLTFENTSQDTAWLLSRPIRQELYRIMDLPTVNEGIRMTVNAFEFSSVEAKEYDVFVVSKDEFDDHDDYVFMLGLVNMLRLKNFMSSNEVRALIGAYVCPVSKVNRNETKNCTLETVHRLAEWRSMLFSLLMLAQYKNEFYSINKNIVSQVSYHRLIKSCESVEKNQKFQDLYSYVLEKYPHMIVLDKAKKVVKVEQVKVVSKKPTNAFALLMEDDDNESSDDEDS
jgi:predicted nuclease of predicted toxin-antitoxin system